MRREYIMNNELIQELALQCTEVTDSTTTPRTVDFDWEEYAKLIIKECIKSMNPRFGGENDVIAYNIGSSKIRCHFGIKRGELL